MIQINKKALSAYKSYEKSDWYAYPTYVMNDGSIHVDLEYKIGIEFHGDNTIHIITEYARYIYDYGDTWWHDCVVPNGVYASFLEAAIDDIGSGNPHCEIVVNGRQ